MIVTLKQSYRAGFASAFIEDSNEVLERNKFKFAETSLRQERRIKDEFHRGYYECRQLLREINQENFLNLDVYINSKLINTVPVEVGVSSNKEVNIFELLDNLIKESDLKKMKFILLNQGYSGLY